MTQASHGPLGSTNIAIVQGIYSAFARRDINAILALLSPAVEWGEPDNPFNPTAGTRHGHEGFLQWVQIGRETEDILLLEPQKFLADADTVAVIGRLRCLAKPTGRSYESQFVHVVTLKDGKVTVFREFFDTYAAGEAFRPMHS